ncbi:SIR2 family protein [Mesorhizobium sp.]|uniref:SIR2 family protein n=1 Tax=Mesorhizobium sp. TaxID=1871066 RepID=UPI000FEA1FED|nr:SIR2 family protein [Mesorhizobium sp.]RWI36073.1 MAG: hypothetical protein EOR14_27650 [Mesorhizobium sp.]RWI63083.1 MAG: hypothetical protein EOR17_29960 [Mesorhizobium sp.]RWJ25323.1 MAG: hypothetical protein EOR28_28405 [Mesorhizobium sp.]TIQ70036.1 MAG: hypothetical protein E5X40_24070 [Mesorhizobium sp.]
MEMTPVPTASSITVLDTLQKLDGDFRAMAIAIEDGEFALWVGSGISRKAPSLGGIVTRAMEFLRKHAVNPETQAKFEPAFRAALKLSEIDTDVVESHFQEQFSDWPPDIRDKIVNVLWNKYSKLLDIRIKGEREDYLLWEGVDIRDAFKNPAPPAAEHLSIAILILEGAVNEIASANWDGFIEAAVERLAGGVKGNLQVVVDPGHLRDAAAKARLLKFHGCIVHATEDPDVYRDFLTASETQIIGWPENPKFAAMQTEVLSAATNLKALMIGLSLQDVNLQATFNKARKANPWPWPCEPKAQGHVFCEDAISDGQRTMLKMVYASAYNEFVDEIESGAHLRSWAEQVLLALILKLLADKLGILSSLRLAGTAFAGETEHVIAGLHRLRDAIAGTVGDERTDFATHAIAVWSRMISLFRNGHLPAKPDAYEVISTTPVGQLAGDMNVRAAGFGEMAIALSLLEHGQNAKLWELRPPVETALGAGAIVSTGSWPGAPSRAIFLARSAGVALDLQKHGAFANENTVVIHADNVWQQMFPNNVDSARVRSRPPGRTGKVGTRHVSIAQMLDTEADFTSLKTRFVNEVTL